MGLDRPLRRIGQHGVGAAEGDDGELGEEDGHLAQHAATEPKHRHDAQPRRHRHQTGPPGAGRQTRRAPRVGQQHGVQRRQRTILRSPVAGPPERARHRPADQPGHQHHQRERRPEREQRDERSPRHGPARPALQGPLRHPPQRVRHQHQDRAFQAEERRRHRRHAAQPGIQHGQRQHDRSPRQHEQQPGRQPAPHAVHQPAQIRRQLHRLRTRQQRAEVERVQEPPVRDPGPLLHNLAVQQRDLGRRTAERQAADAGPNPVRLGLAWQGRRLDVHQAAPSFVRRAG